MAGARRDALQSEHDERRIHRAGSAHRGDAAVHRGGALTAGRGALRELAALFLRLGVTAFGGPAAHVAMMRDEVVRRRQWMSDAQFLDLLGATNLIPGPNSTEMAIHVGHARGGWRGLLTAGICFIAPTTLIVLVLAWAYASYGSAPQAVGLLYGVKPVIIAIVVQALWGLGRAALKGVGHGLIGVTALVLYLRGVNELLLLAAGALAALLLLRPRLSGLALLTLLPAAPALAGSVPFSLLRMFAVFVKIGSVLYGSGYVLLAFLRTDFVVRLHWLTDRQLLDAVAIGQFTPGPVFTTATFIGYLLGGAQGALLATLGIFLPAFVFVAITHPFVGRLRRSATAGALLDGVNVASLALMAGVALQLGRTAIVDVWTGGLAVAALVVLVLTRINSVWLVLAGGVVGLLLR